MKAIFTISKLIIKKKLKFLSESETLQLKKLKTKYPFVKKVDFDYIHKNIEKYNAIDADKAWQSVLEKIEKKNEKSFYKRNQFVFRYAAIVVCLLGLTYFISDHFNLFNSSQPTLNSNAITLRLANGEIKTLVLHKDQVIKTANGNFINVQRNNVLICEKKSDSDRLAYNELKIPFGQKFQVILSDGTKIHLNSGSSLKFPISFINGHYRKVYLTGEAYFEVTKDKLHPFIVQSSEMNIKVLGTKFNVSAYKEDQSINTVLVEGSVQVYEKNSPNQKSILVPGEKATWMKSNNRVAINKVDVSDYTAWRNGQLIFKGLPFRKIVQKLERAYNVSIINNNEELDNEMFSANFNQDTDKIESIMFYISKIYHFTYTIKDNIIIINKY
jgi:transmembrane sensor